MYKQMILLCMVTLALFGCSSPDTDEEARQLAETFKNVQYEIEIKDAGTEADMDQVLEDFINQRHQQIQEYATEKVYQDYIRNREVFFAYQIAVQEKANMHVAITEFNKIRENEDSSVTYHYKMEIRLEYWDGAPELIIPADGQMDVIRIDGKWKVARDWDGWPIIHLWKPQPMNKANEKEKGGYPAPTDDDMLPFK